MWHAYGEPRIGEFRMEEAVPWEASAEIAQAALHPLLAAVPTLARLHLKEEDLARLRQGQWLRGERPTLAEADEVALISDDTLVGIGKYDPAQQLLRPVKMFAPDH